CWVGVDRRLGRLPEDAVVERSRVVVITSPFEDVETGAVCATGDSRSGRQTVDGHDPSTRLTSRTSGHELLVRGTAGVHWHVRPFGELPLPGGNGGQSVSTVSGPRSEVGGA